MLTKLNSAVFLKPTIAPVGITVLLAFALNASAQTNIGSWGVNSSGNWSVAGNWTALAGTMPPRNPSDSATFGTGSSLLTVTLDANETVGAITMNNTNSFVISGGNTLTLDQLGSGATINVSGGSANAIQTAVALNDNLAVAVNSGESLSLSGNIANASSTNKTLSMTGAGTLALSGNNSYGPAAGSVGTIIGGSGGGILQLGSNNALGAGDVTNASSCTLQAAVASVSVTNNFKLGQTLLVGNNGNSNLTLMGVVSGGGSLTKVGTNTVSLGATNIYTGFTTVSSGTLNVLSGAGIIPSVASAGVFYVGNLSNTPAVMTNSGTIVSGSSGVFYIGDGSDLIGTFDMAGGSLTINNAVRVGGEPATGVNPGNGTFNMSGGTVTSLSYWQVGRNYGVGTMNMTGGNFYLGSAEYFAVANSGSTGTFNMSGGNLYATNQMLVAYANGVYESVGVWNLSGSANVVLGGTKRFVVGIGGNGTLNQSGGSLSYTVSGVAEEIGVLSSFGGTGLWDMSAGTATSVSPLIIGDGAGSAGTLTLSGTAAMSTAGIEFGANTGQGTLNLNGGTLTVNGTVSLGTGSGYFDFNGGTLQAGITSASFMSGLSEATVSSGGAIINTSANSITIGQPLVDGGGGFLTKLGSGTLTLSATNTYAGNTTINAGTLILSSSGSINITPTISIAAGATFDVSAQSSYNLSSSTILSASGTGTTVGSTAAAINGASGGTVSLGSQPISLTYNGLNPALYISQGTLSLNGNAFTVNSASALGAGSYTIVQQASGNISSFGSYSVTGTAIGAGTTGSISVSGGNVVLTIQNITPNMSTPMVSTALSATAITYGQALSNSILSGTFTNEMGATISGSLAFILPGTVPGAGTPGESVVFTPNDTTDYNNVTNIVSVTVNQATPTLTTPTASAITYSQVLTNSTLSGGAATNAANDAAVNGSFAFTTPTFAPNAGSTNVWVAFTPTDTTDYATAMATVNVTVNMGTPAVSTALSASAINYGQALSNSILSGAFTNVVGATVSGSLAFVSPGTVPGAGTASQSVVFTPSDTTNYNDVTNNVSVTVNDYPSEIAPNPFLMVNGLNIRNAYGTGDVVHLHGVNVGGLLGFASWMMPLDTSGITDGQTAITALDNRFGVATEQSLFKTYQTNWITNSDYDNIKAMGVNLIRQPLGWYAMFNMTNGSNMENTWRTDAFDELDWTISNAWQRGIYTIIDLAVVQGGVSGSGSTDTNNQYWYNGTD